MSYMEVIDAAGAWLNTHVPYTTDLAVFGFAMLIVLGIVALFLILKRIVRLARIAGDMVGARALRRNRNPGYKIMIARPDGKGGFRARKWLQNCLTDHLSSFCFGAPMCLAATSAIRGGLQPRSVARARRRMARADADLIVWGERTGGRKGTLTLVGLSRGGGLRAEDARTFTLELPARSGDLGGQVPQATAYLLARELQPALANPQSFRPEKMKTVSEALSAMLDDCPALSSAWRQVLEADFCATGVHIAEAAEDISMLDRVIELCRTLIETSDQDRPPERVVQARMNLGRALLARAGKNYDSRAVDEAISHLAKVIEALQADPVIQRAQFASDAMTKAKRMIETRKRFAVNFNA